MTCAAWRRGAWLLAAAALAVSSVAAAVPDWVQSSLITGRPPWRPDAAMLQLLNSTRVTFLTPQRVLVVYRSVRRIDREDGLNHFTFQTPYNADTDRIVSAEAWAVAPDGKSSQSYARGAFLDRVLHFCSPIVRSVAVAGTWCSPLARRGTPTSISSTRPTTTSSTARRWAARCGSATTPKRHPLDLVVIFQHAKAACTLAATRSSGCRAGWELRF